VIIDKPLTLKSWRDDLTRVRDPEGWTALLVEGRRLGSLAGVGAMTSLRAVNVKRCVEIDLALLTDLPELDQLHVNCPERLLGVETMETLTRLQTIRFVAADRAQAEQLVTVRWGSLSLRSLHLVNDGEPVPIALDWLADLPDAMVRLPGFVVGEEAIPALQRSAAREISVDVIDETTAASIRAATDPARVNVHVVVPRQPAGPPTITASPGTGQPVIQFDLAAAWDTETTHQAEQRLLRHLDRAHPGLRARLELDSDTDDFIAYGDAVDLELVCQAIAARPSS
jgi:hypothetical protein